ncbi:MAG: hypothetical protein ACREGF_04005, partial [Candidatus Saccharimonadales bacterium]
QSASTNYLGEISRDPSYLYHYLLSFIYRFIDLFTTDQTVQIIILRFINIGLFAAGLILFRKLLLKCGIGRTASSLGVLIFTLIPIVPLLAGQVNYDNLLFVITAWFCLVMVRLIPALAKKQLPLNDIAAALIIGLLGSLVKFTFLPFFAVALVFIAVMLIKYYWHNWLGLSKKLRRAWSKISKPGRVFMVVLLIISAGLFGQRYYINLINYRAPVPKCDKVLTIERCLEYEPYGRDHILESQKSPDFVTDLVSFTATWGNGMWRRLFFTINGNVPVLAETYQNFDPLPVPSIAGIILTIAAVLAIICRARYIYRDKRLLFLLSMSLVYGVALFVQNFSGYSKTGLAVAINGRYLLVLILPLMAVAGRAFQTIKPRWHWPRAALVAIVLVCFIQGGGVLEFIIQSNDGWYWPNSAVRAANHGAQDFLRQVVIGSKNHYP